MTKVSVPAKLNLTLDITGREGGFHMLDSLVLTVGIFDEIAVRAREDGRIFLAMHGMGSEHIPLEQNNAYRAARLFCERFEAGGADIVIEKNIPMRAGLGGSSADAAGVLLALAIERSVSDMGALKSLADELGSDTGYLLTGGLARLTGRGERVRFLPYALPWRFLVLCPGEGVDTASCYSAFDRLGGQEEPCTERALQALQRGDFDGAAGYLRNALFPAAALLQPAAKEAMELLSGRSPFVSMTGSGSACFAIFSSRAEAEAAAQTLCGRGRTFVVSPALPAIGR